MWGCPRDRAAYWRECRALGPPSVPAPDASLLIPVLDEGVTRAQVPWLVVPSHISVGKGMVVVVLPGVWPGVPCLEHGGAGWGGVVLRVKRSQGARAPCALVKLDCLGPGGVVYEAEWLELRVLCASLP